MEGRLHGAMQREGWAEFQMPSPEQPSTTEQVFTENASAECLSHTHTHTHMRARAYIHTHTHTHTHAHTLTHTHSHTNMLV